METRSYSHDTEASGTVSVHLGAWASWIVLAAALTVTVVAWSGSRRTVEHHLQTEFDALIGETTAKLDDRISDYTQVLRSATALFAAAGPVDREGWRRFIASLDLGTSYPAIPAVAFARQVADADLNAFVTEMRRSGVADFAVRPAGRRERYVVNAFAEPFVGGNVKALGYDMWQDADRRETMERAARTGQPMITQRITLRIDEDINPVPAFIMYLPVTLGERIHGYVLSPFRMPALLQDLLGRNGEFLTLAIYDGTEPTIDTLFYRSAPSEPEPRLTSLRTMDVGGRRWALEFSSRPGLDSLADSGQPAAVLTIGLVLSLLLFAVTWSLGRTKDRAEAIAREKTRSLRESQTLLEGIVDNSSAVIYVKDLSGRILLINSVYERLFNTTKAEVLGKTDFDLFPSDTAQSFVENDRRVLSGGAALTVEEVAPHADGPHTYLSVKFPIPGLDGAPMALCGISTDITEHKAAADRVVEINRQLESQAEHLRRSNAELERRLCRLRAEAA